MKYTMKNLNNILTKFKYNCPVCGKEISPHKEFQYKIYLMCEKHYRADIQLEHHENITETYHFDNMTIRNEYWNKSFRVSIYNENSTYHEMTEYISVPKIKITPENKDIVKEIIYNKVKMIMLLK